MGKGLDSRGSKARQANFGRDLLALGSSGAERLRHVGTGTAVTQREALDDQVIIGEKDDGARHAELLGEISR